MPIPGSYNYSCNLKGCTISANYESVAQRWIPCVLVCDCFCGNVRIVTLSTATLDAGVTASPASQATSELIMSFSNPGSATTIVSVDLTGPNISAVTLWDEYPNADSSHTDLGAKYVDGGANSMSANQDTPFTFYPWTNSSDSIVKGETYNYVISFANGQSVSGSPIAQ